MDFYISFGPTASVSAIIYQYKFWKCINTHYMLQICIYFTKSSKTVLNIFEKTKWRLPYRVTQRKQSMSQEIGLWPQCANIPHTYSSSDIDECKTGTHKCDRNANCANTFGSHTCTCKPGFAGDASHCSGKLLYDCVATMKYIYKL